MSPGQVLASMSTGSACTIVHVHRADRGLLRAYPRAERRSAFWSLERDSDLCQRATASGRSDEPAGRSRGIQTDARVAERRWRSAERNRSRRERIVEHVGDPAGDGKFQLCQRAAGYLHVQRASGERRGDQPALESGDPDVPRHVHSATNAGEPDHGPSREQGDGDLEPAAERNAPSGFVLSAAGSYTGSFPVAGRTLSAVAGPGTYRVARRGDERVRVERPKRAGNGDGAVTQGRKEERGERRHKIGIRN